MKQQNWKNTIARFLTAQTLSLFGSSLVQYAIVWHITLTTSSGRMLTIATLCGFLPQVAISLFAGVWLDRYDRKRIIMLADSLIALATLLLAVVFMTGYRSIWLLFVVLVVRSVGTGIQTPAVNAMIPQIVPKEHLMRINGIHSTLQSCMVFLSPAVSGAVLSVSTLEHTLLIDVVTAAIGVAITSTVMVKSVTRTNTAQVSAITELRAGFGYLRSNPLVGRILLYQLVILFLISPSAFLTPLMVSRTFGAEVWRLTASEMTYSMGMVLGGLIITSWGGFSSRMHTTLLAGTVYGAIMLGLGLAPYFLLYLLLNLLIGVTSPCYNAPITVTLQERVPPEMQGRVFSFMQIATSCALPFGMAFFGPLADRVAIQLLLLVTGSLVILVSGWVWVRRLLQ